MKTYRMNSLGFISEIENKLPLTAHELADELDDWTDNHEAAAMLRMQAEEIIALRDQINELQ